MASSSRIWCKCCKRSDFRCQCGLSQHLLESPCQLQVQIEVDMVERHPLVHSPVHFAQASDIALHQNLCNRSEPEDLPLPPPSPPKKTAAITFQDANDIAQHDLDVVTCQIEQLMDDDDDDDPPHLSDSASESSDDTDDNGYYFDSDLDDEVQDSDENPLEVQNLDDVSSQDDDSAISMGPNTHMRDQFQDYVDKIQGNHLPFDAHERSAIWLLGALKEKKLL